jgi:adenylosuccinate lyase
MTLNELTAISPIDGRYRSKTALLAPYFSEFALIKYRVMVEVEYFIALYNWPLSLLKDAPVNAEELRAIYKNFSEADAQTIKNTEKITNHDVKAVEYFLKDKFETLGLGAYKEFIHFGLTSQDINNTSLPAMMKDAQEVVMQSFIEAVINDIKKVAEEWKNIPMLSKTHGQPASPTKLGKEMMVFVERLENQIKMLKAVPFGAKFGGATGNFNAHHVAFPNENWQEFGNQFVGEYLNLTRYQYTTQIEHYDYLAAYCDSWKRINTILLDFCRDIWTYVSMDYFKQKINKNEVGSSAMPHKVNPIDFENAEGNLGIANALFEHLAAKLPISRLQRDLTDSTVIRNVGVPLSHTLIALQSIQKGMGKLLLNEEKINADLENNWMVTAEAIQTVLRREGYANPYEKLKELTRTNSFIGQKEIHQFIDSLDVNNAIKAELKLISPQNYTGIF